MIRGIAATALLFLHGSSPVYAQPSPIPSPWAYGPSLSIFYNGGGITAGNPTGGQLGVGTLNVNGGYYVNGVALTGGVSSVGSTFTGGLISVSGSPVTTTGTIALTVAGTSGGIPYFSTASTWAPSATLINGRLMQGGGAGSAPSTFILGGDCTFASPNITCQPSAGTLTGNTLNATVLHSSLVDLSTLTSLTVSGLATFNGSIVHNPTTAFGAGIVPGIFQQYAVTGSVGAATSAVVNAFNMTSDNLVIGDPYSLTINSVNDANFGGAAAKGGRIISYNGFTQTAASESTHSFRSYVGVQAAINTVTGDGGSAGTKKGDYYGFWSTNILSAAATFVNSMQGMEIDMDAVSGSSVLYKSGLLIGSSGLAGNDVVHGSLVDAGLWIANSISSTGFNVGIQFGRADGLGGLGVPSTGTLLATAAEVATIATGIDLTGGGNTTISGNAWQSPGATIGGTGAFGSSAGSSAYGSTGTHASAAFNDVSTTPYGLYLGGTYATASILMVSKPDFHYAGTTTCTVTGSIAVLINGVAKAIPYC